MDSPRDLAIADNLLSAMAAQGIETPRVVAHTPDEFEGTPAEFMAWGLACRLAMDMNTYIEEHTAKLPEIEVACDAATVETDHQNFQTNLLQALQSGIQDGHNIIVLYPLLAASGSMPA